MKSISVFFSPPTQGQLDAVVAFLPVLEGIPQEEYARWDNPTERVGNTIVLGHLEYNPAVRAFEKACYDNGLVQSFDWGAWSDEAHKYMKDFSLVSSADLSTCIKLITTHIRADRFSEGHLAEVFRSGHIFAILRRLQQLQIEKTD